MRRYRNIFFIALLGITPLMFAMYAPRLFDGTLSSEQPPVEASPLAEAPPAEPPELRAVLAAARDLPVGTLLREGDMVEVGLENDAVRPGHLVVEELSETGRPYGHALREAIPAGAPLTRQAMVGPRQRGFLAAVLKPGTRALTILLGEGTRHSGLIDPGDRVDVVLTAPSRTGQGIENVLSRTILEDVRVLAVDRQIGGAAGSSNDRGEIERTKIVTATLEVLPEQTGLLALGEHKGELALAVRPIAALGVRADSGETASLHKLLSPPGESEPIRREAVQTAIRVIRGVEVSQESFALAPDADRGRRHDAGEGAAPQPDEPEIAAVPRGAEPRSPMPKSTAGAAP